MALDVTKTDSNLGSEVEHVLKMLNVNTPTIDAELGRTDNSKIRKITRNVESIMTTLGLDLSDDSLIDTPKRIAKMFVEEFFWGLKTENFPKMTTVEAKSDDPGMVLERDITVKSNCEHHFVPIVGRAHIAYIPSERIVGLSKLNRVVEYFSRRPQIQERLTEQIYYALRHVLGTDDIAVVVDARHLCVTHRGVEDQNSSTVTSKIGGCFLEPNQRAEFFNLIRG